MTKNEIDTKYKGIHHQLELDYFNQALGSRILKPDKDFASFDLAHKSLWESHITELRDNGYLPPLPVIIPTPPIDPTDFPALWADAKTLNEKFDILAKMLKLIA